MCRGRVAKASLLLIATCAVLLVSTVAASPAHRHLVGTDCDLCCVGHLPALQSPHLSDIRPQFFCTGIHRRTNIKPASTPNLL